MKKTLFCLLLLALCLAVLSGCVVRIPTSADAKEKMEKAGYAVTLDRLELLDMNGYDDDQLVKLTADQDGEIVLEAYFFRNKKDAELFFKNRQRDLRSNVEAFHKFDHVICRGTASAMEDFLR